MTAKTLKWIGGGLVAALAASVVPGACRADYVPVMVRIDHPMLSLGSVTSAGECSADEDEVVEEPVDLQEVQLALLYLFIGNVPSVNLKATTFTSTGSTVTTGGTTLPGGSEPSGGDPGPPATTPEPATWLLGAIGAALAGLAGALRLALRS
jgi:hypothetical protein